MKFAPFLRSSPYERMSRMMTELNVDVVSLAESRLGQDLVEANATCACCSKFRNCEAWLAGRADGANPYAFCPNGALFDEHARKPKSSA